MKYRSNALVGILALAISSLFLAGFIACAGANGDPAPGATEGGADGGATTTNCAPSDGGSG